MNDMSRSAELAVAHGARLALYARQWLDGAGAQDVVQEALVDLLSQRRAPDDPVAWMYTAVRHRAIDEARSHHRRRGREEKSARQETEWFEVDASSAFDAEEARKALEQLPGEMREIVVLRIWGELGFERIAAIAGISVGTAHGRFTDAIGRLRKILNDESERRPHAGKQRI
jgi:RNA polymerase sigma factor (sigma-70 family)